MGYPMGDPVRPSRRVPVQIRRPVNALQVYGPNTPACWRRDTDILNRHYRDLLLSLLRRPCFWVCTLRYVSVLLYEGCRIKANTFLFGRVFFIVVVTRLCFERKFMLEWISNGNNFKNHFLCNSDDCWKNTLIKNTPDIITKQLYSAWTRLSNYYFIKIIIWSFSFDTLRVLQI